jgi:UDP-N-acetylmuramate dehydrogenase
MNQQFVEALKKCTGEERVFMEEPMRRHTTFRVGGPADVLVRPNETELPQILTLCRQYEIPFLVIGNGSNLLVGDKGIRGLVIEMNGDRENITVEGDVLTAGAGVLLAKAAHVAAEYGLSGMEFAAGIPGTLGGAVVMNAGAYGGEMKDILSSVTVLDRKGQFLELSAEELKLGYRRSCIPENGYIVTKVMLRLSHGDREQILVQMEQLKQQRVKKQPLEYPSAGSTFKRPEGYFAGKLIMDAGLRGYQVGGAQVSEKHCGFVINRGDATAADIRRLMQEVSDRVEKQFGVALEPEVKILGEF